MSLFIEVISENETMSDYFFNINNITHIVKNKSSHDNSHTTVVYLVDGKRHILDTDYDSLIHAIEKKIETIK